MRRTLLAAAVSLAATMFAAAALAAPAGAGCAPGLHPAATAELFFGDDLAPGDVMSFADWRGFYDQEVRPRFPNSLPASVFGQDRGQGNGFHAETAKAVILVLTGAPDEPDRLAALRAAYHNRFGANSVLVTASRACVAL